MLEEDWTPELIEEYKKCSEDIVYFAEKYINIVSVDEGRIKLKMYDAQKRILSKVMANRFSVFATARQIGKTTIEVVLALWHAIFKKDYKITILANKQCMAEEIIRRIRLVYEDLPKFLLPSSMPWFTDRSKNSVTLENGSSITAISTTVDALRGKTVNLLIFDEYAFTPTNTSYEVFACAVPTISCNKRSKIVILSTPNGTKNKFYEVCQHSQLKDTCWAFDRITWRDIPGRDEQWKAETMKILGNDQKIWDQEYEAEFVD